MRSFRFSFPLLLLLAASALACSAKATLVGQGGECQLATDCQDGLICAPAPQKNGTSICTSDLSGVQQLPPNPDAGGGATPPAKDASAATGDSASTTPTPEASTGGG